MAIFHRTNTSKSAIDPLHHKKSKALQSNFWSLTYQKFIRAQNAIGKSKKRLRRSVNSVRRQFIGQYLKGFLQQTKRLFRKLIMSTKQQVGLSANANDGGDAAAVKKPSIIVVALSLLHRFLCLCVRFVVTKVHGEHGQAMPSIDDLLLLESATSIAEKIRTKKVTKRIEKSNAFLGGATN